MCDLSLHQQGCWLRMHSGLGEVWSRCEFESPPLSTLINCLFKVSKAENFPRVPVSRSFAIIRPSCCKMDELDVVICSAVVWSLPFPSGAGKRVYFHWELGLTQIPPITRLPHLLPASEQLEEIIRGFESLSQRKSWPFCGSHIWYSSIFADLTSSWSI